MIRRISYLALCGVFFAGIVHIVIILLIPLLGSKDAARQIVRSGETLKFERITDDPSIRIADVDPFFETAICRYDLSRNGVLIEGPKIPTFWSASVFDEDGRIVYSLSNRSAIANILKVVVVNPVQMADIRELQPEEIETSILVESAAARGFLILRALVRDASFAPDARRFLDSAICKPYITR